MHLEEQNPQEKPTPPGAELKQLPAGLERTQAVLFDGLRHAGEIAQHAHSRLRTTLTEIAHLERPLGDEATAAFLDAWAIVDAADRFRQLWKQLPERVRSPKDREFPAFDSDLRNVRNINDHLAQRLSKVVSTNSSAMGVLVWFTALSVEPLSGLACAIVPGTLHKAGVQLAPPQGKKFEGPSGLVRLDAGGHSTLLCDAVAAMNARLEWLDLRVQQFKATLPADTQFAPSDMLIKALVQFGVNPADTAELHTPDTAAL